MNSHIVLLGTMPITEEGKEILFIFLYINTESCSLFVNKINEFF